MCVSFRPGLFSLIACLCLAACGGNYFERPVTPPSVQLAGVVHISPIAIDRWEDFVGPLQAQFTLTADGAVTLALPKTSAEQNSVAELFSAGVQLGLTATQPTPSTTPAAPAAPASPLPALAMPNAANAAFPAGPVQYDPVLAYSTASSIYQEIQLLNRYLNSAALRSNYKPYLVRLQVNVSPLARNEPYDTYIDLGMFSKCQTNDNWEDTRRGEVYVIPLVVTDDVESGQTSNALNIARQLNATLSAVAASPLIQGALLGSISDLRNQYKSILGTTYNSLYSISRGGADNVLQVRLGAARDPNLDTAHTTGFSIQTQSHNVSFLALVDENHVPHLGAGASCVLQRESPLPISSTGGTAGSSDPSPQASAGAALSSDSAHAPAPKASAAGMAVAQSTGSGKPVAAAPSPNAEIIRAFPLVDKSQFESAAGTTTAVTASSNTDVGRNVILVLSRTRFRSVDNGDELAVDRPVILEAAQEVASRFSQPGARKIAYETFALLARDIQANDFGRFRADMTTTPVGAEQAEAFWTYLASVVSMSEFGGATIELPARARPPIDEAQTLVVHDNCQDTATVTIPGAGSLSPGSFRAALAFKSASSARPQGADVAAIAVAQAVPGGPFTIQFPSLNALKAYDDLKVNLRSICADPASPNDKKAAAPPPAAVTLPATLRLEEVLDTRWGPATYHDTGPAVGNASADAIHYDFANILYDKSVPPDTSVGLIAAADTITADPTGAGSARLIVKLGKQLSDVSLTVAGAVLSATSPPHSPQTPAAVTVQNGGIVIAPGAVTPAIKLSTSGPYAGQVVVDVPLQGLSAGRSLVFTAVGEMSAPGSPSPKPQPGATAIVVIPVVPLSTNGSKTSPQGGAPSPAP